MNMIIGFLPCIVYKRDDINYQTINNCKVAFVGSLIGLPYMILNMILEQSLFPDRLEIQKYIKKKY